MEPQPAYNATRRQILKTTAGFTALASSNYLLPTKLSANPNTHPWQALTLLDDFARSDSNYHGDAWESFNPGFWKIDNQTLRRRFDQVGQRARETGFPFHHIGTSKGKFQAEYDPTLPPATLWRRNLYLRGESHVRLQFAIHDL